MNTLLLKYIVEVEKEGSISRAAQNLYMTQPHLSKAIRELEDSVGITVFRRTSKGVIPTQKGIEFLSRAKDILSRVDELETMFDKFKGEKLMFDIVVPRASYIAEAFSEFLNTVGKSERMHFDYRETNSVRAVKNVVRGENTLGIIRYRNEFENYFLNQLEEHEIKSSVLWEFDYAVLISASDPVSKCKNIDLSDLDGHIRLTHGDLSVPSMPLSKAREIRRTSETKRELSIYERASQFRILSSVPGTYMLVSYVPQSDLDRYGLVQIPCSPKTGPYKDVLIYKEGYTLTDLDRSFLSVLKNKIEYIRKKS